MRTHALHFVWPTALLAAAVLLAGNAATGDPLPLPEGFVEAGEPASGTAEPVETDTSAAGMHADWLPTKPTTAGSAEAAASTGDSSEEAASAPDAEAQAPPASRLLRALDAWAGKPATASPPPPTDAASADAGQTAAEAPVGGVAESSPVLGNFSVPGSSPVPRGSPVPGGSPVLHGCPRALLGALLASAADADDAVSALAIERETLALCRERQEVVNGIVALESELGTLLAEARAKAAGPVAGTVGSAIVHAPIVKVSAPVRVVSLPPATGAAGEGPKEAEEPEDPAPPSYFWFSIVGTAGDLRAGVSGVVPGERLGGIGGGTSVWFVREGDRLPGGVTVTRIVARPPGVHVEGAAHAALPYRPRHADNADPRGDAKGSGNTPPRGSTAGAGS